VTGKWLFPKQLIDQWIEASAATSAGVRQQEERPYLLVAGSDDPSLGILRECYTRHLTPASFFLATVGSSAGLAAVRDGVADLALAHLLDPLTGEYNLVYLQHYLPAGGAVVTLFHRVLGLVVAPGNPLGLRTIADLGRQGVCLINRQQGSGTRSYLDQELVRLGLPAQALHGYQDAVVTHLEVGLKVLRREADVGLATEATARLLGLDFVPLTQERFDMLIPKARFFSQSIQLLLEIVSSLAFRTRVEALGGYDTNDAGRLHAPHSG
jgi:molybdate-binding protein